MIVAVTGHQPTGLWGYQPNPKYRLLRQELGRQFEVLIRDRQAKQFLFGMAQGADSIAFDACLRLREQHQIELVAVAPYAQFPNRWERDQYDRYQQRLCVADQVVHVDTLPEYAVCGTSLSASITTRSCYRAISTWLIMPIWS